MPEGSRSSCKTHTRTHTHTLLLISHFQATPARSWYSTSERLHRLLYSAVPSVHTTLPDVSQQPQGSPSYVLTHRHVAITAVTSQGHLHNSITTMASRFVENFDSVAPISHPHLNVSLDDILAEEGRKRSSSQSSESSQNTSHRSGSNASATTISPTNASKMSTIKRSFTIISKKDRRAS